MKAVAIMNIVGRRCILRNGTITGKVEEEKQELYLNAGYKYVALVNGSSCSWTKDGKFNQMGTDHDYDIVSVLEEVPLELMWTKEKPKGPGIYAHKWNLFDKKYNIYCIDESTSAGGFYCYLAPIPDIKNPPKQKVSYTLYVRPSLTVANAFNGHWIKDGDTVPSDLIKTNKTKVVEE